MGEFHRNSYILQKFIETHRIHTHLHTNTHKYTQIDTYTHRIRTNTHIYTHPQIHTPPFCTPQSTHLNKQLIRDAELYLNLGRANTYILTQPHKYTQIHTEYTQIDTYIHTKRHNQTQIDTIRHKYTHIYTYLHTIPHKLPHSWVGHKKSHIYIYLYIYTIFSFILHTSSSMNPTRPTTPLTLSFKKILQSKNKSNQKKFIQSFIQKKKIIQSFKKIHRNHRIHNLQKNQ